MPPVQFGFCVPIFASPGENLFRTPGFAEIDPAAVMTLARRADELGYDSLWVADHLMLGHDEWGANWIQAHRAKQASETAAAEF